MLQGILNRIAVGINAQKTVLENAQKRGELNDPKKLAQLDALETLSDAFTSTSDLNAAETFDANGTRTVTYTDPTTGMLVKSTSYDPSTGNRIADFHYENGVLSDSGTYDPATGKKVTDSHYDDNGALMQTDTLDADGHVVRVDYYNSNGVLSQSSAFDPETGEKTEDTWYGYSASYGGQNIETRNYKNGTFNQRQYDENGILREIRDVNKDGSGGFATYDSNGNLIYKTKSPEELAEEAKVYAAEQDSMSEIRQQNNKENFKF